MPDKAIPTFDEFAKSQPSDKATPSFNEFSAGPGRGGAASTGGADDRKPGFFENMMSHAGSKLAEIPGAIGSMLTTNPATTIGNIYDQQKHLAGEGVDAFRSGDYPLAMARGVETLMPGVGPNLADGFKTIRSGDTSGGIGDMIGGTGPALVLKSASMSPKVRAFAGGMKDAATENVPSFRVGHVTVQTPVPAPLAGAFAGAGLGRMVGHPIPGAVAGAVLPVLRGGMRAAEGEPWVPPIEPMQIPQWMRRSPPESITAEFRNPFDHFEPSGQKRLGAGPIVTPPPPVPASGPIYNPRNNPMVRAAPQLPAAPRVFSAEGSTVPDGSYVRGVPAMTQPPNPARALPAGSNVIQMPGAPDGSFVRGVPAEYGFAVPREGEILSGPLSPPEANATPIGSDTPSGHTARVSQSRSKFDANGKRK